MKNKLFALVAVLVSAAIMISWLSKDLGAGHQYLELSETFVGLFVAGLVGSYAIP